MPPGATSTPARGPAHRDRAAPVLLGALLALGVALVVWWHPQTGGPVLCPFLALTGWNCPMCGGLRTVYDMATADLAGAWAMNPLLVLGLPALGLVWLRWLIRAWTGRPARYPPTWLVPAIGVLLVLFTIARNLPGMAQYLGPA